MVGRAQAAARMRSAPITSGKALSVRPWQMRGVLRLGRSADLWPTWWLHRRRIHVRALRVHPALRNLAVSVAAVGPPGWCTSPAVSHRPRKPQRPPVAGPWMPPCGSLAPRTTTLRMDWPAKLRTRQQPSARCRQYAFIPGTRSSPVNGPPCHRASAARTDRRSTGSTATATVPSTSPISSMPLAVQLAPWRSCAAFRHEREGAADFQRLGTCHRKGESAVGVSTDSATPTI